MNKLMFGHFNKGFIKRMLGYAVMNMSLINIIKIVYVHLFYIKWFYHLCTLMQRTYKKVFMLVIIIYRFYLYLEKDRCMINQKAFDDSIKRLKDRGYRNIESKLFDNMFHEILNEKNNQIVYNTIINF